MYNHPPVIDIAGNSAALVSNSTAITASDKLPAGVYAVWAVGQPAYISVAPAISTSLTSSIGFPILAGAPTMLKVPAQNQISAISTVSSGAYGFEKVGPYA